jgi:hypothetical protein
MWMPVARMGIVELVTAEIFHLSQHFFLSATQATSK